MTQMRYTAFTEPGELGDVTFNALVGLPEGNPPEILKITLEDSLHSLQQARL